MSYKKFLLIYLSSAIVLVSTIAFTNYYIDIYGLFRGSKDCKVHINERTSKYLFSYRYIPENFDGFIIGPSLSANLNPEQIRGHKIYNASIMGANITELSYLMNNIAENGHMKFAIICLDPYLTKDHGKKSANIDPKEYYGALGSTNLLKTYLIYFVRKYNLYPGKYAANTHNPVGWDNFELETANINPKKAIEDKVALNNYENTAIDSIAYSQLDSALINLRKHNIKIIGYFSPVPYKLYQLGKNDYNKFENKISQLFKPTDILINLNNEAYKPIIDDYTTYIDHGHLSSRGQAFVLSKLQEALNQNLTEDNSDQSR